MEQRSRRRPRLDLGDILRLAGAGLVLFGALAALLLRLAPAWVLVAYLLLGVVSFGVYGFDKRAARRRVQWHIAGLAAFASHLQVRHAAAFVSRVLDL